LIPLASTFLAGVVAAALGLAMVVFLPLIER
jgi:hypothetical protein